MDFYLFFNHFGYSIEPRFKKKVSRFNECFFNFSFLFDKNLDGKWNGSAWFNGFL